MLTLAPSNGFTGTVSLACSGLPAATTCSFSQTSVNVTGTGSVQSTLTFASGTTYTPPGSYAVKASAQPKHGSFGIAAAAITPFAALLLFGAATRRRFLAMLPLVLLGVAVFAGIAGCGGSSGTSGMNPVPTPTGTSQVTVTATSGSISQNTTITLTVQ